jgi:hypothetical protein
MAEPARPGPRNPLLYQLDTRVELRRIGQHLGRPATLDDVPDADLDRLRAGGFDWVYLLGVWRTGTASRDVSRRVPAWRAAFAQTLDDLTDDDICGSCFAVIGYEVHPDLGGDAALTRFRARLAHRGLRLMLDFVPNHTALDHPWVRERPHLFVTGTERDLAERPHDHVRVGERVLAHGRDPNVGGWPDTLQLDYREPEVHEAMTDALVSVADRSDGIRVDMAMLVLPEVFERTWGGRPAPFWPRAIARLRARHPSVVLMAEVYWDLERELLGQGFDLAYDKGLYDRLVALDAGGVRDHLQTGIDQHRLVRFLENHDEPRAAVTLPPQVHRAASLLTYLVPGLRFLHQGQLEGFRIHVPPHLCRGPDEPVDPALGRWYERLLSLLREPMVRDGDWALLDAERVAGHGAAETFVTWTWTWRSGAPAGRRRPEVPVGPSSTAEAVWWLVVVNYGPHAGRCRVRFPYGDLAGRRLRLVDRLNGDRVERDGDDLTQHGLEIELPGWGASVLAATDLDPAT